MYKKNLQKTIHAIMNKTKCQSATF